MRARCFLIQMITKHCLAHGCGVQPYASARQWSRVAWTGDWRTAEKRALLKVFPLEQLLMLDLMLRRRFTLFPLVSSLLRSGRGRYITIRRR